MNNYSISACLFVRSTSAFVPVGEVAIAAETVESAGHGVAVKVVWGEDRQAHEQHAQGQARGHAFCRKTRPSRGHRVALFPNPGPCHLAYPYSPMRLRP